jgi:L-ascorbate metabolism protein UlaG (beta-lactamase superfamily)
VEGLKIEAVPATMLFMLTGEPFHPKGVGNGYIITFGDKRVYVAGDTENIPEMKQLKNIDIAFLPMNLPYTMTPEMVADAAKPSNQNFSTRITTVLIHRNWNLAQAPGDRGPIRRCRDTSHRNRD